MDDVFNAVKPVLRGVFEDSAAACPSPRSSRTSPIVTRSAGMAPTSRTSATRSRCSAVTEHFAGSAFKVFAA